MGQEHSNAFTVAKMMDADLLKTVQVKLQQALENGESFGSFSKGLIPQLQAAGWWGIGGSIPFMAMLGERFPEAQFVITGVLGPESNAHGPNEFLHLPTARRVSACMAHVIDAHARR